MGASEDGSSKLDGTDAYWRRPGLDIGQTLLIVVHRFEIRQRILGPMGPTARGEHGLEAGSSRLLFVSDERAWPTTSGYRRRTAQILGAVARLGHTTWVLAPRNRYDCGQTVTIPDALAHRITVIEVAAPTRSRWPTAARWLGRGRPWPLAAGDWREVDAMLRGLADESFDLIWAMGLDALHSVRRAGLRSAVVVVDADLESLKLRRQLDHGSISGRVRRTVAEIDHRRWRRLEQEAARSTTGFSVCSDDERRLLGGRAFVTPNSYPLMPRPAESAHTTDGAVLLFVGSLDYQPNVDGLRWFVSEVLPEVRNRVPGSRLKVVGSGGDAMGRLDAPGVEVLGAVDDVGAELSSANAVVVPILWGAGTRIKILEAFSCRVPVVSTTVGAEGLNLQDERELLISDDAQGFAIACERILNDRNLARRLVDRAHETLAAEYEDGVVRRRLTAHLLELLSPESADY